MRRARNFSEDIVVSAEVWGRSSLWGPGAERHGQGVTRSKGRAKLTRKAVTASRQKVAVSAENSPSWKKRGLAGYQPILCYLSRQKNQQKI